MSYNSTLITKAQFYSFVNRLGRNTEVTKEAKLVGITLAWWEHADRLKIKCQKLRNISGRASQLDTMNPNGTYKDEILDQLKPLYLIDNVFTEEAYNKKFAVKSQLGREHRQDLISNGAKCTTSGRGQMGDVYSVSPLLGNSYMGNI